MKTTTPKALITGASTGIGAVYADRLASRGYDVIIIARDAERLRANAARIRTASGREAEVIAADLTRPADRLRIEERLRADSTIEMLVNNAGLGALDPLLKSNVDDMEKVIDLNVTTVVRLSYAAAPGFVERGRGTIINISSVLALAPELFNGVYDASKSFVLAFTQSLHQELSGSGVRVQAVLPGATATDIWSDAGRPLDSLPAEILMTAEDMVDAALAGLDADETVTIPPLQDAGDWDRYNALRQELSGKFGHKDPAPRYRKAS